MSSVEPAKPSTSSTFSKTTQSATTSPTDKSGTSTPSTTPTDSTDNKSSGNTPVGAIVGGVVGGVAGLALVGLGLFLFFKRSRKRQESRDKSTPELKSLQEQSLKGFNGVHLIPQSGTVLEAPGDVASPRYELSGASVNPAETRYELS